MNPAILVTGATGATGRATVAELQSSGIRVRALVHEIDARSEQLSRLGAEVVQGDLLDFQSVRSALEGMQRAYFLFPVIPGIVQAAGYFAQAANEVRLEAIVNMSQITARRDAESHATRDHWIAERLFDRSGISVTHLRPTVFAEWMIYFASRIAQDGCLALPFGTVKQAAIAAEDQGRVIATILVNPGPHKNQTYSLYGAEELTFPEMVDEMSKALDRPIRYQQIDFDSFEKGLLASGGEAFLAQHMRAVAADHRNGLFGGKNDVVEKITGRKPLTIREFILKNKQMFAAPPVQSALA
jgi:NAD(P)H dehydrogenase (quinone)